MNAMKGMKLCYKDRDSEKAWTSNIKVGWNLWIVLSAEWDILVFEGLYIVFFTKIGIGKTVSAIILEILVLDKLTLLFIGIEKIIVGEKNFGIVKILVLMHSLNRHLNPNKILLTI